MNNNITNWQYQVNNNLEHNRALMARAVKAPIVRTDEHAQKFFDGWRKLLKMDATERKTLFSKSAADIGKEAKDGDVAAFCVAMDKAMGLVNRVLTNTVYNDPFAEAALLKDLHSDGPKSDMNASRIIDMGARTIANEQFDLGWTQAFTAESAEDVERLKLYDWNVVMKMLEYSNYNDDLIFQSFGGSDYGELGPKYFATAVRYSDRDMRFSAIDVNRILEAARREAQLTITRAAYREIFDANGVSTQALSTEFSGATAGSVDEYQQTVLNARRTMNDARVEMIDNANAQSKGSKRVKIKGTPLAVPANSPIVVYHSHRHEEFLGDVQYMNKGVDSTKPTLYGNFAFVSTTEAPTTGAWTVTSLSGNRDDYGFFNEVKEHTTVDNSGVMLVIPGGRNIYATFRNLSMVSQMNGLKESTEIALKQEFNFAMGDKQKRLAYIK